MQLVAPLASKASSVSEAVRYTIPFETVGALGEASAACPRQPMISQSWTSAMMRAVRGPS